MCDKSNVEAFKKMEPMRVFETVEVQSKEKRAQMQNCVHFGQALAELGDKLNLRYLQPGLCEIVLRQSKRSFNMVQNKGSL